MLDNFTFGSKEWQEYYHGRNNSGKRPKPDRAKRSEAQFKKASTKKGLAELDQSMNDWYATQAREAEEWGDLAQYDSWPVSNGYSLTR